MSKIPNDVSTKTFKRGLSLHETLCATSSNNRNLNLSQNGLKRQLIPEYKDINQSSESNFTDYNILNTPLKMGMSTPEKTVDPQFNFFYTPQQEIKSNFLKFKNF